MKDTLDFQGYTRDVGGVFEHRGVACHQGWCSKAEDLPVRKVPGHDRQHHPQWTEGNVALRGVGGNFFISKEALGILGKEVAVPGAFFDLGLGFCDRFAHFQNSNAGQFRLAIPQMACHAVQIFPPFSKRNCAPVQKSLACLVQGLIDLLLAVRFKCFQHFSSSWINRLNAHQYSSHR